MTAAWAEFRNHYPWGVVGSFCNFLLVIFLFLVFKNRYFAGEGRGESGTDALTELSFL